MSKRMTLFGLILVGLTFLATPAWAQTAELTRYTPVSSQVLIGFNIGPLKDAPIYQQLLGFVRSEPKVAAVMMFLQEDGGLDIEKDINGVLLAFPKVADATKKKGADSLSVVVNGKFDKTRLLEAARKRYPAMKTTGEGENAKYEMETFTFSFASPTNLVLTMGKDEFIQATWTAVASKKASAAANKEVTRVMKQINTSRGLWLVGITKEMNQTSGAQMNSAGLTVDLTNGLQMEMIGNMATVKDAKQAEKEFSDLRKQGENPMVAMVGAKSLVDNLKASRKKKVVTMTTRMSQPEFDNMTKQMGAILAQGSTPMPRPTGAATVTPGKAEPAPSSKGVDADFN